MGGGDLLAHAFRQVSVMVIRFGDLGALGIEHRATVFVIRIAVCELF